MAASKSLRDILGYLTLTGMVNANVPTLPKVLPQRFYTDVKKVAGNAGRYTRSLSNRTTARLNKYGAPSTPVNLLSIGEFDAKCFYSYENLALDPWMLLALRNYENYNLQERGKDEVARQIKEFRTRMENLRNTIDMLVLSRSKIWLDGDGNLLPSASGAVTTCDFAVPASQVGATIATITGISGAWTSTATDIPTQLISMKKITQQATGYEAAIILYGKNIPAQLAGNDLMQPYLAREPDGFRPNWVMDGDIKPDYDLFGYKWYPAYQAFWNDQNGDPKQIIDDNAIIFLPPPSSDWWEHMEGEGLVPTSIQPTADLTSANESFKAVHGMSSWALQKTDPVGITMYAQDVQTPVIKVPNVLYSLLSA